MCCFIFKVISLCTSGWLPGWWKSCSICTCISVILVWISKVCRGQTSGSLLDWRNVYAENYLAITQRPNSSSHLKSSRWPNLKMARQFKSEAKTSTVVLNHKSKPEVQLFRTELGMSNLKIATMLMKKMFLKQLIHCFKNIYIVDTQSLNKHVHQSLIMQVVSNAVYQISKNWN